MTYILTMIVLGERFNTYTEYGPFRTLESCNEAKANHLKNSAATEGCCTPNLTGRMPFSSSITLMNLRLDLDGGEK